MLERFNTCCADLGTIAAGVGDFDLVSLGGDCAVAAWRSSRGRAARAMPSNHSIGIVLNSRRRGGRAARRRRGAIGDDASAMIEYAGAAGAAHSAAAKRQLRKSIAMRRNRRWSSWPQHQLRETRGRPTEPGDSRRWATVAAACRAAAATRRSSVFGVEGKATSSCTCSIGRPAWKAPPLAAAKRQLLESLQSLESVHQFHIIFFNTKTQAFDISGGGRRIAFATDRNKQLAANFVGGITADGGTDRMVALREALSFCAGRDLLSDRCRRPDVGERTGRDRAG